MSDSSRFTLDDLDTDARSIFDLAQRMRTEFARDLGLESILGPRDDSRRHAEEEAIARRVVDAADGARAINTLVEEVMTQATVSRSRARVLVHGILDGDDIDIASL